MRLSSVAGQTARIQGGEFVRNRVLVIENGTDCEKDGGVGTPVHTEVNVDDGTRGGGDGQLGERGGLAAYIDCVSVVLKVRYKAAHSLREALECSGDCEKVDVVSRAISETVLAERSRPCQREVVAGDHLKGLGN